MKNRVFLIVLDSLGIGAMPDAEDYGDEGSNTLAALCGSDRLFIPNLHKLGIFNIDGVACGK
ncbi:MAG TPA: phosphopentomutase, partial [Clostridia bacterium]|nr:phosphopentomutase [Clostridia bacterium]